MENFNKIEQLIENSIKLGKHHYVVGFKGDINKWQTNGTKYMGKPVPFNSYSDRKLESEKTVDAEIMLLTNDWKQDYYLGWKVLYRNTKGVYFKKKKDKFYIAEGEIKDKLEINFK